MFDPRSSCSKIVQHPDCNIGPDVSLILLLDVGLRFHLNFSEGRLAPESQTSLYLSPWLGWKITLLILMLFRHNSV